MRPVVLLFAVMGLVAPSVLAEDLSDPPWDPTLPYQTSQSWEFDEIFAGWGDGTSVSGNTPPSSVENPYGGPYVKWPSEYLVVRDEEGNIHLFYVSVTVQVIDYVTPEGITVPGTPTVHIGVYDPEAGNEDTSVLVPVSIWVPNSPEPNLVKKVFWQMTSDKSPTPQGNPPTTIPPGTAVPTGIPQIQHDASNWYTYNGEVDIPGNPPGEWLKFGLVSSTNIEEIVVKTVCMPEPATLGLLAAGAGLMFLRRRR